MRALRPRRAVSAGDWGDQGFQIGVCVAVNVRFEQLGAVLPEPEIEADDVGPGLVRHPTLRPKRENLPLALGLIEGPLHN